MQRSKHLNQLTSIQYSLYLLEYPPSCLASSSFQHATMLVYVICYVCMPYAVLCLCYIEEQFYVFRYSKSIQNYVHL